MTRDEIVRGLAKRIEYAAQNSRATEEIAHTVNVLTDTLERFVAKDQMAAFWRALEEDLASNAGRK